MASLNPPSELSLNGNVPENWARWKQRLELYISAIGLTKTEEDRKISILLTCLGENGIEIYNSFVWTDDEEKKKYCNVVKKFDEHFLPKKNVTFLRHKFFTRSQEAGETIDQFVTDLRNKSKDCEFGDLTEGLITDRLVCGTIHSYIKERLLREPDLKLTKALEICHAAEITCQQMKVLEGGSKLESSGVHMVKKSSSFQRNNNQRKTFSQPNKQVVLLGLAVSSLAQFQSQSFDGFDTSQQFQQPQQQFQQPQQQFQQPQQQFQQPQRFASQPQPQFQAQPQRVVAKIRRPQSHKFVDPDSVSISPAANQGVQTPQARFPSRQQFAQPAVAPRAQVKQHQFESEFVQGVQTPAVAPRTQVRQRQFEPEFGSVQTPAVAPRAQVRQRQFDSQFVQTPTASQDAFQQEPPQFQSFEPAPAPQVSVRTQTRQPLEPVVAAPVRTARPRLTQDPTSENEEVARHQAETAMYSFQAAVTDTLSDNQNVREEVRDGLAVKGVYSYSDGYFKRTVHYEADQNGYRVVKEDVEPIGDGPQEDPNGSAEITSNVGGNSLQYTITAADINPRVRQSLQPQQTQQQQQRFLPQQ